MSLNVNSFAFFSKVQEVEIKPNEITGHFDGYLAYLWVPIICTFRMPEFEFEFEVLSVQAKLRVSSTSVISEIYLQSGKTINKEEDKFIHQLKFPLTDRALEHLESYRQGDLRLDIELNFQFLYVKKKSGLNR